MFKWRTTLFSKLRLKLKFYWGLLRVFSKVIWSIQTKLTHRIYWWKLREMVGEVLGFHIWIHNTDAEYIDNTKINLNVKRVWIGYSWKEDTYCGIISVRGLPLPTNSRLHERYCFELKCSKPVTHKISYPQTRNILTIRPVKLRIFSSK